MAFLPFLHRVSDGERLSEADAREAMSLILSGHASTAQIAGFLVAIKMRGESGEEIVGFAKAMRERVVPVPVRLPAGEILVDTCGTGGDGLGTFNISTVSALVLAGAGVRVAKHGNRSASGIFGSADLLEALGVKLDVTPETVARQIAEIGIGFLFAPAHHPSLQHVRQARLELKMRTVFNLMGPLANPAGAQAQLIGAPSVEAAEMMAHALTHLDVERALVVHGLDGLDEISTTGPTMVFEVEGRRVHKHVWTPADFAVPRAIMSKLIPASREENIEWARAILDGASGPARDIVLVNAAAVLYLVGRVKDLRGGVAVAGESIGSGAARAKLEALAQG
jgi:anthranilate phosphoribosyltransferase